MFWPRELNTLRTVWSVPLEAACKGRSHTLKRLHPKFWWVIG